MHVFKETVIQMFFKYELTNQKVRVDQKGADWRSG